MSVLYSLIKWQNMRKRNELLRMECVDGFAKARAMLLRVSPPTL